MGHARTQAPRKVLITGGCGFIGHHVAEQILHRTNYEVVCLDRIDATSTTHRLQHIVNWPEYVERGRIRFVWHDLRAPINGLVQDVIGPMGANDVILHLAASTHVDRSIMEPMSFVQDNVVGTTNILDFAARTKTPFLQFSTDEVFGPALPGECFTENARFASSNPYAASKSGSEELARAYANTYGIPVAITRCMNAFGERQHPEKFVPLVIGRILNGQRVLIHADKTRTIPGRRGYLYAPWIGQTIERLISTESAFGTPHANVYHLQCLREVDNLEMAQFIAKVLGRPLHYDLVDFHSARPGHDLAYRLTSVTLERTLGPLYVDAQETAARSFWGFLTKTVEWYQANPSWLVDAQRPEGRGLV